MADDDTVRLDPTEQRVIGSLLEKERTVPASYPMTLNGLRTACNQTSGRDPILQLTDEQIAGAVDRLKDARLLRLVHASHGARTVKHRQVLDERLDLGAAERAIITLLLLRGPQTSGELRSRSERLHGFADLGEVEGALTSLAARTPPLVAEQDRRPGQKERRWIHLLGPVAEAHSGSGSPGATGGSSAVAPGAPSPTERVLRDGPAARDRRVVETYDRVAETYAERLADELDHKPFDRWLLERLADLSGSGPVAEVGCGPGHVAFHLAVAGAEVTGFDLSPAMIDEARRRYPEVDFEVGDLTDLRPPSTAARTDGSATRGGGWSAIVAWYSLVHMAGSELRPAIGLLTARLAPGGVLAVAVHVGPELRHLDDWWGHDVDIDFALHDPARVLDAFAAAGLESIEWYRRSPIAGAEAETERLYVVGRRPTS